MFRFIFLFLISITFHYSAESFIIDYQPSKLKPISTNDNILWDNWLKTYVSSNGVVNYKEGKKDIQKVEEYLKILLSTNITLSKKDTIRLAYFINLYNALVIYSILNQYPIKSVQTTSSYFFNQMVYFMNTKITLNELEKKYIQDQFKEPLVHFALNCGSISCPILVNQSYKPTTVAKALVENAKEFASSINGFQFDSNKNVLYHSELFNWYKELGSPIDFYNKYNNQSISSSTTVKKLPYNWNLNEK